MEKYEHVESEFLRDFCKLEMIPDEMIKTALDLSAKSLREDWNNEEIPSMVVDERAWLLDLAYRVFEQDRDKAKTVTLLQRYWNI